MIIRENIKDLETAIGELLSSETSRAEFSQNLDAVCMLAYMDDVQRIKVISELNKFSCTPHGALYRREEGWIFAREGFLKEGSRHHQMMKYLLEIHPVPGEPGRELFCKLSYPREAVSTFLTRHGLADKRGGIEYPIIGITKEQFDNLMRAYGYRYSYASNSCIRRKQDGTFRSYRKN